MNLKKMAVIGAALLCCSFSNGWAEAAPHVPEDIFRWVQSSARTNYYFNRQQICFAVKEDGTVDTENLIVPVLKTFDDVMINDVVSKRRWNGKSLQGFDDFVGVSEYLTINLPAKKVSVNEINYLDSTWTSIPKINDELRQEEIARLTKELEIEKNKDNPHAIHDGILRTNEEYASRWEAIRKMKIDNLTLQIAKLKSHQGLDKKALRATPLYIQFYR